MARSRWFVGIVLCGLVPIVARLLAWWLSVSKQVAFPSAGDVAGFGVALSIANIGALGLDRENIKDEIDWHAVQIISSLLMSMVFGILCFVTALPASQFDQGNIAGAVILLASFSLAHSYFVWHKISGWQPLIVGRSKMRDSE